jgi:hypothetical protein
LNVVRTLVFPWVGAVIVNRHPANRIGWLLCAEGVVNGTGDPQRRVDSGISGAPG